MGTPRRLEILKCNTLVKKKKKSYRSRIIFALKTLDDITGAVEMLRQSFPDTMQ